MAKRVKRFEQSNGLDTALYLKTTFFFTKVSERRRAANIVTMLRPSRTSCSVAKIKESSIRDRTNRKHCLSHQIWSYKKDGPW